MGVFRIRREDRVAVAVGVGRQRANRNAVDHDFQIGAGRGSRNTDTKNFVCRAIGMRDRGKHSFAAGGGGIGQGGDHFRDRCAVVAVASFAESSSPEPPRSPMLPVAVANVPDSGSTDVSLDASEMVSPAANVKPVGSVLVAALEPPHFPVKAERALELVVVAAEVKIKRALPFASVVSAVPTSVPSMLTAYVVLAAAPTTVITSFWLPLVSVSYDAVPMTVPALFVSVVTRKLSVSWLPLAEFVRFEVAIATAEDECDLAKSAFWAIDCKAEPAAADPHNNWRRSSGSTYKRRRKRSVRVIGASLSGNRPLVRVFICNPLRPSQLARILCYVHELRSSSGCKIVGEHQ